LPVSPEQVSNQDIVVREDFLATHEPVLLFCVYSLVEAATKTPGTIDTDVMAALEALIQTYRTLESGLIYETRPENHVASAVQRAFSASLDEYQKTRAEREGIFTLRNSELLKIFAFLHRIGQQTQNGRPRGRMFLDLLRQMTPNPSVEERAPSIIL
jgi:hypothetical protein